MDWEGFERYRLVTTVIRNNSRNPAPFLVIPLMFATSACYERRDLR
jgi:hypothetical protein